MNDQEQIRSFIAIELPEDVLRFLSDLQQKLKKIQPQGIRWVRPEGIHLTLKFLGNVPAASVPQIKTALSTACAGAGILSLGLSSLGVFPSKNRPRVIWVGLAGDLQSLASLQAKVDGALERLGFPRENRPFSPHLTLGRVEETVPAEVRHQIGGMVDAVRIEPNHQLAAGRVSLMQSKLTRGGAIYSRLAAIDL